MKKNSLSAPIAVKTGKPSKADLQAAYGKTVPEILAPRLKVLFVGINPGTPCLDWWAVKDSNLGPAD